MCLKSLCVKNIVEMIKNLPPLLKDEIMGEALKEIREDEKKKMMKEVREIGVVAVEDISSAMTESFRNGVHWTRPDYLENIDDDLYHMFVDIAEYFTYKNQDTLTLSRSESSYSIHDVDSIYSEDENETYIFEEEPEE